MSETRRTDGSSFLQRAVISLKMSFIDAPASSTKDWPARNKEKTIANMAGVRHRQFLAESHFG
jgi:hypothetical protein